MIIFTVVVVFAFLYFATTRTTKTLESVIDFLKV